MELLTNSLPPLGRHIVVCLTYLIGAALLGLIAQQTGIDMVKAIATKQVEAGLIELPLYPFKPFITLGFGLASLVFLLCAVDELRAIIVRPEPNIEVEVEQ